NLYETFNPYGCDVFVYTTLQRQVATFNERVSSASVLDHWHIERLYHVISFDLHREDFSQRGCILFSSESAIRAERMCRKLRRAAYRSNDMQHLHFVHKYENGLKVEY